MTFVFNFSNWICIVKCNVSWIHNKRLIESFFAWPGSSGRKKKGSCEKETREGRGPQWDGSFDG